MRRLALVLALALALQSCSKSRASGSTQARMIPAPLAGYTCFEIVDGSGNSVGGNCVKD